MNVRLLRSQGCAEWLGCNLFMCDTYTANSTVMRMASVTKFWMQLLVAPLQWRAGGTCGEIGGRMYELLEHLEVCPVPLCSTAPLRGSPPPAPPGPGLSCRRSAPARYASDDCSRHLQVGGLQEGCVFCRGGVCPIGARLSSTTEVHNLPCPSCAITPLPLSGTVHISFYFHVKSAGAGEPTLLLGGTARGIP